MSISVPEEKAEREDDAKQEKAEGEDGKAEEEAATPMEGTHQESNPPVGRPYFVPFKDELTRLGIEDMIDFMTEGDPTEQDVREIQRLWLPNPSLTPQKKRPYVQRDFRTFITPLTYAEMDRMGMSRPIEGDKTKEGLYARHCRMREQQKREQLQNRKYEAQKKAYEEILGPMPRAVESDSAEAEEEDEAEETTTTTEEPPQKSPDRIRVPAVRLASGDKYPAQNVKVPKCMRDPIMFNWGPSPVTAALFNGIARSAPGNRGHFVSGVAPVMEIPEAGRTETTAVSTEHTESTTVSVEHAETTTVSMESTEEAEMALTKKREKAVNMRERTDVVNVLQCPINRGVMRYPVMLSCCGNHIGLNGILLLRNSGKAECPICRNQLELAGGFDRTLQSYGMSLKIPQDEYDQEPDPWLQFRCPVSLGIMRYPMRTHCCSVTMECEVFIDHFEKHGTCAFCKMTTRPPNALNVTLGTLIDAHVARNDICHERDQVPNILRRLRRCMAPGKKMEGRDSMQVGVSPADPHSFAVYTDDSRTKYECARLVLAGPYIVELLCQYEKRIAQTGRNSLIWADCDEETKQRLLYFVAGAYDEIVEESRKTLHRVLLDRCSNSDARERTPHVFACIRLFSDAMGRMLVSEVLKYIEVGTMNAQKRWPRKGTKMYPPAVNQTGSIVALLRSKEEMLMPLLDLGPFVSSALIHPTWADVWIMLLENNYPVGHICMVLAENGEVDTANQIGRLLNDVPNAYSQYARPVFGSLSRVTVAPARDPVPSRVPAPREPVTFDRHDGVPEMPSDCARRALAHAYLNAAGIRARNYVSTATHERKWREMRSGTVTRIVHFVAGAVEKIVESMNAHGLEKATSCSFRMDAFGERDYEETMKYYSELWNDKPAIFVLECIKEGVIKAQKRWPDMGTKLYQPTAAQKDEIIPLLRANHALLLQELEIAPLKRVGTVEPPWADVWSVLLNMGYPLGHICCVLAANGKANVANQIASIMGDDPDTYAAPVIRNQLLSILLSEGDYPGRTNPRRTVFRTVADGNVRPSPSARTDAFAIEL